MRQPGDTLTSDRLLLRRFTADDLEVLHTLNSDPRVMEHLGGPLDREASAAMLEERVLAYYDEHPGLGIWATHERAGGEFVGVHNLNHIRGESIVQVGYLLLPRCWGRGYATEMATVVLRYGFATLGLPRIAAIADLANVASHRVLLKAGLRRNGERSFPHPAYAKVGPLAWFERDAAAWLAEHPQAVSA